MRIMLVLPMLALLAPGNVAPPAAATLPAAILPATTLPAVGAAATHAFCGDDLIAPSKAQIMPGFGSGALAITARAPAQAFFDNGLQLAHAFAHGAATGQFVEAERLDPLCAMCVWGEAWSRGPTINFPIDTATQVILAKKLEAAERLAATGPALEQQMIAALRLRYQNGGGKGAGDLAFARAMDAIARAHPDSDELTTIAADAWMIPASLTDTKANLPRAIELLETVLHRNPSFTPAIHFYIHATEMMGEPGKAESYADRLPALAPAASHLIHMPSHTYYWVGRYQDAAVANVRAAAVGVADAKAAGLRDPGGVWTLDYHAHNVQFGVGGALISGDAHDALALSDAILKEMQRKPPESAYGIMAAGTGYAAQGRFADPDAVLALPDPGAAVPLLRAYWHYARGEALARQSKADAVRAEAAAIVLPSQASKAGKDMLVVRADTAARDMAAIARLVLLGRAAMLEQKPGAAIKAYTAAARIEESKAVSYFADPPAWWYPVRRSLAAALLAAGRPGEALTAVNAAMARRQHDPVGAGLRADILAKLGRDGETTADRAAAAAWKGDRAALSPALS